MTWWLFVLGGGHDGHNRRATGMQPVLALTASHIGAARQSPRGCRCDCRCRESPPAMHPRTCTLTTLHPSTHPHIHASTRTHMLIHPYAHRHTVHTHATPRRLATSDPGPQLDAVGSPEDDGPQGMRNRAFAVQPNMHASGHGGWKGPRAALDT